MSTEWNEPQPPQGAAGQPEAEEPLEEHMEEQPPEEEDNLIEGEDGEEVEEEEDLGGALREAASAQDGVAGEEIVTSSFTELRLDATVTQSAQDAWRAFINNASSREAAGEAIYSALFESAPSLQSLFTTPRAVQAMRFMNGLNSFIMALDDPPALKILVETLGFGHLNLDVTVPRVIIFRDAILDLFQVELGDRLDTQAYIGWKSLLNYVGGAIIFIKEQFSERLRILSESWKTANDTSANNEKFGASKSQDAETEAKAKKQQTASTEKLKKAATAKGGMSEDAGKSGNNNKQEVPTTFPDMFRFNAAVMGFGNSLWMQEVLACFNNIVTNVANSQRLQEECDVLVLRISRVATGKVNLGEFKSCMLASLRSLLPKDWTTNHEVVWCWLWENVERLLLKTLGSPPAWEKAYHKFVSSLDESQAYEFRAAVYAKFFQLAPAGEDYFKQSNTYLHIIAIKIMQMVLDMYREPIRMTDDISALGLRHVGYGIPTEFFGPFVTAVLEVLVTVTEDESVVESTRWSLGLIAKSLVRTILEGSTIVMKAINLNTKSSINKAISCAPRGERSQWMLIVAVGTQNISPLAWSIEGGKLEAASAIMKDLLTFRADRDRYYYGANELFTRHPDIIKKLCDDAPVLLPELLNGLVWRSRLTSNGQRRVNYYMKHLLVDLDGKFHQTLDWIAKLKDPNLVCHPVLVLLMDLTWAKAASLAFLFRKSWFLLTLVIFIISQSILKYSSFMGLEAELAATFAGRLFNYVLSMGQMLYRHTGMILKAYRRGDTVKVRGVSLPRYLQNWQDSAGLILMIFLLVMLSTEPIFYCWGHEGEGSGASTASESMMFTEACEQANGVRKFPYSTFSMLAMFLFYVLLIDLAVFSTRFSSYVLACGRMLSEVALYLLALVIVITSFACAFSCLDQDNKDFQGIHLAAVKLWELMLGVATDEVYEHLHDQKVILYGCYVYLIVASVFLSNMLIAQLSCSYGSTYVDMIGFARLRRMKLIVETMATLSDKRWERFYTSLRLDEKLEFNEGDIGLAGGIQAQEVASANPTTVDMIQRFGGSTSPTVQWPSVDNGDEEGDRFERMEKLVQKALSRMTEKKSRGGASGSKVGSASGGGSNVEESEGRSNASQIEE